MRTTALVFALLMVGTFALSLKEQRLKSMNKLSYESLFTEIQSQITAGGPLTSILDTIEKFDSQIREEQAAHDAMWAIQQSDCSTEIAFRNQEIQDGTDAYNRAFSHHATCSNSLARAEVSLETNLRDQADTDSALRAITDIRNRQHLAFVAEQDRHNHALNVLGGALDFLDELVAGDGTLLQLSQYTMQLIQTGTSIHAMENYAPVVTVLAQMAADENDAFVDEGAVERVRRLIEEVIGTVRVNLDALQATEAAQLEEFNTVSANLEATLRDLAQLEARLSTHIDQMNNCVLEEQVVMTTATAKVDRNTEMLETAETMCATFAMEYEVATEGRNEERDLLRIIRVMAERRMVRYADASTESKYGDDYGASYENMEYNAGAYTSTSDEWQ